MNEGLELDVLPRGRLVGVVDVTNCNRIENGFAWDLDNARRFVEPITYKGAAGMFLVDDEIVAGAIHSAVVAPKAARPVGFWRGLFGGSS